MASLSASVRYRKYLERLASAFEFYEDAVARGLIRSYGICTIDSMITEQSIGIKAPIKRNIVDQKTG